MKTIPRLIALFLCLALTLPAPARASPELSRRTLRIQQSPSVRSGLEESLRPPTAGAEEALIRGGVDELSSAFRSPPDFHGLAKLHQAVEKLPAPAKGILAEDLRQIRRARTIAGRWVAADQWVRDLNEQVLLPQRRVAFISPRIFYDKRGIELVSYAYPVELVERRKTGTLRFPVVYVKSLGLAPFGVGYNGLTVPAGILINLGDAARFLDELVKRKEKEESFLPKLWPGSVSRLEMSRALVQHVLQEELRHLQMLRPTIPRSIELAVTGRKIPRAEAEQLLGLKPDSFLAGALKPASEEGLSAAEFSRWMEYATEAAAAFDRLMMKPPLNEWGTQDLVDSAVQWSLASLGSMAFGKKDRWPDAGAPRAYSLARLSVRLVPEIPKQQRNPLLFKDALREKLSGMDLEKVRLRARRIWRQTFREEAVPLKNPLLAPGGPAAADRAAEQLLSIRPISEKIEPKALAAAEKLFQKAMQEAKSRAAQSKDSAGAEEDPPGFLAYQRALAHQVNRNPRSRFLIMLDPRGVLEGVSVHPVQGEDGLEYEPILTDPFTAIVEDPSEYRLLGAVADRSLLLINVKNGKVISISGDGTPETHLQPGSAASTEEIQGSVQELLATIGKAQWVDTVEMGISEGSYQGSVAVELDRRREMVRLIYLREGLLVNRAYFSPADVEIFGPRGSEELRGGLEERLAVLAEALPGGQVLAVQASEISRRAGLEEFLARAPRGVVKMIVFGKGSPIGPELSARNDVLTVDSDDPADLGTVLAGLEEERVVFLGDRKVGEYLKAALPPSMSVAVMAPGAGLEEVLLALGLPAGLLGQVNASGLEEQLARDRAA